MIRALVDPNYTVHYPEPMNYLEQMKPDTVKFNVSNITTTTGLTSPPNIVEREVSQKEVFW